MIDMITIQVIYSEDIFHVNLLISFFGLWHLNGETKEMLSNDSHTTIPLLNNTYIERENTHTYGNKKCK